MNPIAESSKVNEASVGDEVRELDGSPIDQRDVEQPGANKSVIRSLMKTLMLIVALIGGAVFGLYKMRVDIPALNTQKIYAHIDSMVVHAERMKESIVGKYESYFHKHEEVAQLEEHHITVTSPIAKDVVITQEYVCQIHSRNHIDVCALEDGYLKAIPIKEGQEVKVGQVMFEVVPVLYKARWEAEVAERDLAKLELDYTKTLAAKKGVSEKEVQLYKAKLAKAQAKADLAEAEFNFTSVKAPFDGIVDRLKTQQGSLVKEGDILTTLSDNKVMWVYFNVTEKRYLEFMAETGQNKLNLDIVLMLANHTKFPQIGKIDLPNKIGAIEANFNNETGNIAFRADFPNPNGLLRHGQTGTVLINRPLKGAIVIPQRATFENLAKQYVYVVNKDDVVHQREITIEHELEDIYVIETGILAVDDKIVLEGIRQVRDGEKVEYEFRDPVEVMKNQKNHAE
jgi:membrane fusion protein, multidrug efflux system